MEGIRQARRLDPLREIFSRKLCKSTLLAIVFASVPLIGTWAAVSGWTPTWVDQMKQMELSKQDLSAAERQHVEAGGTPDERKDRALECVWRKQLAAARQHLSAGEREKVDKAPTLQTQNQLKEHDRLKEQNKLAMKLLAPDLRKQIDQEAEINKAASSSKGLVQVFLALGAITGCFIAPVLGGILGAPPGRFGLCVTSLAVCQYLYRFLGAFDAQFMVVAFLAGGVTAAFYGWLPLYLPEIFPTRVRATGQGLSFNFGRVMTSAAALWMGYNVGSLGGNYAQAAATVTLIYLVGMVVIWFAPETKGRPLPE